jgi:hypothetical protein
MAMEPQLPHIHVRMAVGAKVLSFMLQISII